MIIFEKHIPISIGTSPGLFTISTASGTYVDVTNFSLVKIDTSQYDNGSFYYEAVFKASAGTAACQLYDNTGAAAVASSEITTTSTSPVRVRSGALTLTSGDDFKDQFKCSGGNTNTFYGSRVVVVQSGSSIVTTESQILNFNYNGGATASTSYVDPATIGMCLFLYTSANWNGTVNIYFEATIKTSAGTGFATLATNAGVAVTNGEISTTSTSYVRVRGGSAMTLVNATVYKTQIKNSGAGTTTIISSRIIIQQSGSPSKTESHIPAGNNTYATSVAGYTDTSGRGYYDPANWSGLDTIAWYAEYSYNSNDATSKFDFYALTDAAEVTNSEVVVGIGTTRSRSSALTMPATAQNIVRRGSSSGTLYHSTGHLVAVMTWTTASLPTVITNQPDNIKDISARANGDVTSDGGGTITERGIVISTSPNPTISDTKYIVSGTTGAFSANLINLLQNTTYHIRAYATNSAGTSYGSDVSFTTLLSAAPITTYPPQNISKSKVDIDVSIDGNYSNVTEKGIVYAKTLGPTKADNSILDTGSLSRFTNNLTGLDSNTRYYARGYAILSDGSIVYGNTVTFLTASTGVQKHYIYRVYDTGVYKATWTQEVISEPQFTVNINGGAGQLKITLSRSFDDFGEDIDVKLNNKVNCYVIDSDNPNGLLLYSGYISGYQPMVREALEQVEITVLGYVAETQRIMLQDSSGNTTLTYNSQDPSNILKDIIDKYREQGGTVNYNATSIQLTNTIVSYTFNANTIKEAIDKIIELCPVGWFWRIDPDDIIYLSPKNSLADHTFTIGLHIENLATFRRIEDLVNRVYFIGGGNPALFRKYENVSSQQTYGLYIKKIVDQRVTVAATAQTIANREINQKKDPEIRSIFDIIDNNGPQSRGYDIETIKVGQTLQVKNLKSGVKTITLWDQATWDSDVWDQTLATSAADIIQILSITYQPDSIRIEASSRLPQIAKRIEDVQRNLEVTQSVNNPSSPT